MYFISSYEMSHLTNINVVSFFFGVIIVIMILLEEDKKINKNVFIYLFLNHVNKEQKSWGIKLKLRKWTMHGTPHNHF